jgi:hypothetical protein
MKFVFEDKKNKNQYKGFGIQVPETPNLLLNR